MRVGVVVYLPEKWDYRRRYDSLKLERSVLINCFQERNDEVLLESFGKYARDLRCHSFHFKGKSS